MYNHPCRHTKKCRHVNCFPGIPWTNMGACITSFSEALAADKALSDSSAAFAKVSGTDRTGKGFSWATNWIEHISSHHIKFYLFESAGKHEKNLGTRWTPTGFGCHIVLLNLREIRGTYFLAFVKLDQSWNVYPINSTRAIPPLSALCPSLPWASGHPLDVGNRNQDHLGVVTANQTGAELVGLTGTTEKMESGISKRKPHIYLFIFMCIHNDSPWVPHVGFLNLGNLWIDDWIPIQSPNAHTFILGELFFLSDAFVEVTGLFQIWRRGCASARMVHGAQVWNTPK